MCFLLQLFNFLTIKQTWNDYLRRKELAKTGINRDLKEKFGFLKRQINIIKVFCKNQKKNHELLILKLTTSGTFENSIFMAIVGLIVGIFFTFVFFYEELYLGDGTVVWSFIVRLPLFVLITVLLAFTKKARCYLLLAPLQLFSTSGQVFMGGQVMILVAGGPLNNLRHNLNVIQESSSCQQRGVSAAAAEIADILFGPFSSFKQAAKEIIDGIKTMVDKLQNILAAFKKTVMTVANAIQDATKWINSKINGCKTSVGTTYQHCMEAFSWMYGECKVNVPSMFVKMCSVTEFASNLCSSVKPGEYLCDLVYFNIDPLVTTINQRINRLWDRAYTLMYFKVDIHHEYNLDSNSKSIAEELKDKLLSAFDSTFVMTISLMLWGIASLLLQFYFLWAIFRYRSMYLRREEYDNFFINEKLKSIDKLETFEGHESIFPLRRVERRKYVKVTTFFLVKKELKNFSYPSTVVVKTMIVLVIIGVDYVLHFITDKCRLFMLAVMQTFGSRADINIEGFGFIAELSRRVISTLTYMDYNFYYTHFIPCMPNPKPPNSWTNKKIFFFLVMLWFSWIIQPYVLRFRHIVMDYYYPHMYNRRAKWLYSSIGFKRVTFMSLIRVKLRAKYGSRRKALSAADLLRARYPWVTYIIGKGMLAEECMICNHIKPPLYHCSNKDCLAIYCDECYINIRGICSLCKENMMLDDFKDAKFNDTGADELMDGEDADDAAGLFLVYDDTDHYLDYAYQGGIAHVGNTLPSKVEIIQSKCQSGDVEKVVTTFYYCVDDGDFNIRRLRGFNYALFQDRSYKGIPLTYEDTFEMY